jgi:putative SOS response-associated peptidase YedK
MCGRFALTLPREAVAGFFRAAREANDEPGPRLDIRPTQAVDAVALRDARRVLGPMRWGFLPHWYKTQGDGPLIINARSEEIATKPAFRDAVRETRCLIPADGFYEWTPGEAPARERVHWLAPAAGGLVAFAGVWRLWKGADGAAMATVAIVTCAASADLAAIHHRMPVVIAPGDHALWLGEAGRGAALLMRPAPEGYYAVEKGRGPGGPPGNSSPGPSAGAPK